jgi:hypothetical protein
MGSSATAKLAWGIDFGDPDDELFDWDEAGIDEDEFESDVMPVLLGFTEPEPEEPAGLMDRDRDAWHAWREANRKPYNERRDVAVPLKFTCYGYELGGNALVLKRSLTDVDWGAVPVDPATLAPPTAEELAAFAAVTSRLGFDGGEPKLLLMAEYG